MGVDGVRGIDPLDGVGEGGGSGEVPGDPREGNGSVDCRKVAVILAEVEDGARWLRLVTRKFRNRAKAPGPRSSMKVALAERERWCRRSLI